jgi:hypothetical protein
LLSDGLGPRRTYRPFAREKYSKSIIASPGAIPTFRAGSMTNGVPDESMSFDESVLAGVALVGGVFVVVRSVWALLAGQRVRCGDGLIFALPAALLAGCGTIVWALLNGAAAEVRESVGYVVMLAGFGLVWMGLVSGMLGVLGVSLRVHAMERKNPAAMAVWCGAVLGAALCYAGGSIGDPIVSYYDSSALWIVKIFAGDSNPSGICVVSIFDEFDECGRVAPNE